MSLDADVRGGGDMAIDPGVFEATPWFWKFENTFNYKGITRWMR